MVLTSRLSSVSGTIEMYRKYMHVERISGAFNPEINGLLTGEVWVFPKLDGSNHSVFWDAEEGIAKCGSRNKVLSEDDDSTGFYKYFMAHPELAEFVENHKNLILYGEFMTPHTIKTYLDSVWNNYYVFDVAKYDGENLRYIPYTEYKDMLWKYDIHYIPTMGTMMNPDMENLEHLMEKNNYLMEKGQIGEGIVVKNYDFINKYGRTTWGKLVREEFKVEAKSYEKGYSPEELMAQEHVTKEFVTKEFNKFTTDRGEGWNDKMIPEFIQYVWHEWWVDYSFELVAQSKNPVDIHGLRKAASKLFVKYLKQVS